jgi:hypothetical protein
MNSLQIPFANLDAEMVALQERSEFYQNKITALKVGDRLGNMVEIQRLHNLDNGCQSAIAFCFARRQPAI